MKNLDQHYDIEGLNIPENEALDVMEKYYLSDRNVRTSGYRDSQFFIEKQDGVYRIYREGSAQETKVVVFEDGKIREEKSVSWDEVQEVISS